MRTRTSGRAAQAASKPRSLSRPAVPAVVCGQLVSLRYPRESDRAAYIALRRASRKEFRRWEPLPKPGFDAYGDDAFNLDMRRARSRSARRLLICRNDDGAVVGRVSMGVILRGDLQQCFVGYWIGTRFTGRGYMTEALTLAADYIFTRLKLHRFECNIQPANEPSRSVARKAGLRLEGLSPKYLKIAGVWADHERWAMTLEDWEQRTRSDARPYAARA